MEILDVMEGGFSVRYPVSLSLGFASVPSVWTQLRFQLLWLRAGLERIRVSLQFL